MGRRFLEIVARNLRVRCAVLYFRRRVLCRRSSPRGGLFGDRPAHANMDGLDLVDRLQKEGIRVPTILLTGQLDKSTRQRAANLGIASIVEKPFAADHLIELIRRALLERN